MNLLTPLPVGRQVARCRVMFGPHETNLGQGRQLSDRHVAYYRERAAGGCGIIVTEEASVHRSDWPYERAPEASQAGPGWAAIGAACRPLGALVVAGLGHSGGQGSSAFSQRELWAPSDEPEVNSREVPKVMEPADIAEVVAGFAAAAAGAAEAGLDGVEVNAGQHSLLRQFLSGLTNRRNDEWGQDRLRLAREVLEAVRAALGPDPVLGLRLSCDELAPWAGLTPDAAAEVAAQLAPLVDYLVVVRGSIFSVAETRPTGHHGAGFNRELARTVRDAIGAAVPVLAQGSIVDPAQADEALAAGQCDGVEMTRAQIADPELVSRIRHRLIPRPCVLCNQWCRVRDNRNPVIGCVAEPRAGHETIDPALPATTGTGRSARAGNGASDGAGNGASDGAGNGASDGAGHGTRGGAGHGPGGGTGQGPSGGTGHGATEGADGAGGTASVQGRSHDVLVVGAGPAGLEAARVAAQAGHRVVLADRAGLTGGMARAFASAPGHHRFALLIDWLTDEAVAAGAELRLGRAVTPEELSAWPGPVIVATGGRPAGPGFEVAAGVAPERILRPEAVLAADGAGRDRLVPATVAIWDPVGGPVAVGVAELLAAAGRQVTFVTPDPIVGTLLSLTGDLAGANVRLQQAGVAIERRYDLRRVTAGGIDIEHRFSGERRTLAVEAVVDCGHRVPDDELWREAGGIGLRVGDVVAPRTVGDAIREGRAAALALAVGSDPGAGRAPLAAPGPVGGRS